MMANRMRPSSASRTNECSRSLRLRWVCVAMALVAPQAFGGAPPGPRLLTSKQLEQALLGVKGEPVAAQSFSFPAIDTTWFAVTVREQGRYEVRLSAPAREPVSAHLEGADAFLGITFPQRPDGARDVVAVGRGVKGFVFLVFVQWTSMGAARFERSSEIEDRLEGVELSRNPVASARDAYRAVSAIDSRCSGMLPAPFAIASGQAPWIASYTLTRGVHLSRLDAVAEAIAPALRDVLARLQPSCTMRGWAHGVECVCGDLVADVNERLAALSLRLEPLETVPIPGDGLRFETFSLPARLFACPGETNTSALVHRAAGRTWVMVTPAPGRLGRVHPTEMCDAAEALGEPTREPPVEHESMRLHVF